MEIFIQFYYGLIVSCLFLHCRFRNRKFLCDIHLKLLLVFGFIIRKTLYHIFVLQNLASKFIKIKSLLFFEKIDCFVQEIGLVSLRNLEFLRKLIRYIVFIKAQGALRAEILIISLADVQELIKPIFRISIFIIIKRLHHKSLFLLNVVNHTTFVYFTKIKPKILIHLEIFIFCQNFQKSILFFHFKNPQRVHFLTIFRIIFKIDHTALPRQNSRIISDFIQIFGYFLRMFMKPVFILKNLRNIGIKLIVFYIRFMIKLKFFFRFKGFYEKI